MDTQYPPDSSRPSGLDMGPAMASQVGDKVESAKGAVNDFGRRTVDRIDAGRQPAAGTLASTASALHQQADKVAWAAHAAADSLQATAEYVRTNDVKAMATDVAELVRRHPGPALAAAVVLGMLVGRGARVRA